MSTIVKIFCALCIMFCVACDGGTTGDGNNKEPTVSKNYATPTTENIGNYFTIHKFVGENDQIGRGTAVQDVNHYLGEAETYIKGLANGFNQPEKFQPLINALQSNREYNVDGPDGAQKLDAIINGAFSPCEAYMVQIIDNLGGYYGNAEKNLFEREAFEQCYRVLANEAYYKGYGADRNKVKDYYENEKKKLITVWSPEENEFLTANLINVYQNNNFTPITYDIDSLLGKAASKMGVNKMDLRKVVNIALAGESLHAMHDLTGSLLNHKQENMMYNPVLKMQRAENTLYKDERNKYESMSLDC